MFLVTRHFLFRALTTAINNDWSLTSETSLQHCNLPPSNHDIFSGLLEIHKSNWFCSCIFADRRHYTWMYIVACAIYNVFAIFCNLVILGFRLVLKHSKWKHLAFEETVILSNICILQRFLLQTTLWQCWFIIRLSNDLPIAMDGKVLSMHIRGKDTSISIFYKSL